MGASSSRKASQYEPHSPPRGRETSTATCPSAPIRPNDKHLPVPPPL